MSQEKKLVSPFKGPNQDPSHNNMDDSAQQPMLNGNGGPKPIAGLSMSKGLRSIHTKIHNNRSNGKKNNQKIDQEDFLDLNTPRDENGGMPSPRQNSHAVSTNGRSAKLNGALQIHRMRTLKDGNAYINPGLNGHKSGDIATYGRIGAHLVNQMDSQTTGRMYPHVPAGELVPNQLRYHDKVSELEFPETGLNSTDYNKRLRFEQLKSTRIESLCKWKQNDVKGIKKNAYIKEIQKKNESILSVTDKSALEKLEVYTDRFPLLHFRKQVRRVMIFINLFCKFIIETKIFENSTIFVIVTNSVVMMFEGSDSSAEEPFFALAEDVFLVLYTIEAVLKIVGRGFIMGEDSYLRDAWNILDFSIVLISYVSLFSVSAAEEGGPGEGEDAGFSPASLRVFRVLRPLKAISSIKGLKVLMVALFSAMPLLRDTLMILLFFFIIFAIGGCQLVGGELKNRCFNIQTGKPHPDTDMLCGIFECPGGYYCAKANRNPNNDTSNFDNLTYSLLTVFQCVTMEGWSDVQDMMQRSYSYYMFFFFVPLVFIGAFFLLNLTLAVINSKFTEAHNEQQLLDKQAMREAGQINYVDNVDADVMKGKDEMSIAQFITARIYAKKMIEFLRMRQEVKRITKERLEKVLAKQKKNQEAKRNIGIVKANGIGSELHSFKKPPPGRNVNGKDTFSSSLGKSNNGNVNNTVIKEEENEHFEEASDGGKLDKDIKNFLKDQKARQGPGAKDIKVPSNINTAKLNQRNEHYNKIESIPNGGGVNGGPTMKGNIGPSMKKNVHIDDVTAIQKKIFSKMAEEFDIDNVIPKNEQKNSIPKDFEPNNSMQSFELSIKNYEIESNFDSNSEGKRKGGTVAGSKGFSQTPDLLGLENEEGTGLITSDSDFEAAEADAGYKIGLPQQKETPFNPLQALIQNKLQKEVVKQMDLRKDVTRTFKKMLTSNHNRQSNLNSSASNNAYGDEASTKYGGSQARQEFDNQTQLSEIESKFKKKKESAMRRLKNKTFKDEDEVDDIYAEDKILAGGRGGNLDFQKTKKEDIRQLEEFISTKRPKDPFKELDPLIEKVDINPDARYQGTSQNEVFQQRLKDREQYYPLEENQFLQFDRDVSIKNEYEDLGFVRTSFQPYQQKVFYDIHPDSSPIEGEVSSDNENMLYQKEQPYTTPTSINYSYLLKQIAIKELARRSDVLITSTLSLSMYPKDKRKVESSCKVALMSKDEIEDYVDQKAAFFSMVKENNYQSRKVRDKDKDFRDNYLKSFIHKSDFCSKTLKKFKFHTQMLNSNVREETAIDKAIQKAEKQKHEQNKRASEKRGLPKFDLEMARRLLDGKFHEEDEDDAEEEEEKPEIQFTTKAEIDHKARVEKFENTLHQQNINKEENEDRRPAQDEIPREIRKQFKLPTNMNSYGINFHQIRQSDISKKKQKPMWSGQDVLPLQLSESKSEQVISQINNNRVWPVGLHGLYKRARFIMRIKVKSALFDTVMTFAVLCNTVALAMQHHGITAEQDDMLKEFNIVFTWLFIYEMGSKLIAIGIGKYVADKMNYIDGTVVILSIVEIIIEAALSGGGGNLQQFQTLRMMRTFRVFRIARLLRALESMQTIIQVMVKSYKSFIYITILMFLFIYIFSLLGASVFGGKLPCTKWVDCEDGQDAPRANYDTFPIAFVTVFQVLTMENWQTVLFASTNGKNSNYLVAIYYVAWIFIGNFILLNLFLAILLDSFLSEDEDEDGQDDIERRKQKIQRLKKRKNQLDQKRVFMSYNFYQTQAQIKNSKQFFGQMREGDSEEDLEDLDEDQIVKIFKQQGIIKKNKEEIRQQPLYVGVNCKQALFLFSMDGGFRKACYKSYKHPLWETIVMLLIVLSSLKLATDTWADAWQDDELVILIMDEILDTTFTVLFFLEMAVKIIALGLIMDDGSYLRDNWNRLDFFIVWASVVEYALKDIQLPIIKIFRMLRVLRPLRFISHNVAMRLIVGALIESVGSIFNVLSVVAVMFLIFAIVGVSFFGGGFFFCSIDKYKLHNESQCMKAGGEWENQDHNFDTVGEGMISLFVVSSLEGWPDIMFQALDLVGEDKGPQYGNSNAYMIYFIAFILIGSFFLLNFFIGVLFLEYNKAQKEEQKGYSDNDLHWQDIQRLIIQAQPEYTTTNVPVNPLRRKVHDLVSSEQFEKVIMSVIVLNMIQMAVLHEGQSKEFTFLLSFTNTIFTIIFILEALLKLIAYGDTYFNNSWNQFDFFVVVSSIFDILMEIIGSKALEGLASAPQIARVLRVLRVLRVVRLAGKAEDLQAIIQTVQFSIPSLMNVFLLLCLIFFMFAILGNFIFKPVTEGDVITEYKNYGNALNGFLFLFALSTGEDWNRVMFDCSRQSIQEGGGGCIEGQTCGSRVFSVLFHCMLVLVCTHVMLNLFILVIIQQFEKYYLPDDNMITKFKTDQTRFLDVWQEFTKAKYNCKKIKENQLTKFFRKLGEKGDKKDSLGFGEHDYEDGELKKQLLKMAIKSDNGYIYFNELLYRCMRRKYGNMKIGKKMQIFELKTQYSIYLITLNIQNQTKKLSNDDIFNSIIKKENGVNPFLTIMNFKISFKTWMKFARKGLKQKITGKSDQDLYKDENDQPKMIAVDIEVEELYEVTSEEDVPETSVYALGRRKSIAASGMGQLSPTGSQGGVDANVSSVGSFKKKKKDHLQMFEKKMSQKLKWQQILSGSKRDGGQEMARSSNAGSSQKASSDWRKTQFGMALQKTRTMNNSNLPSNAKSTNSVKSPSKKMGRSGNSESNPNL